MDSEEQQQHWADEMDAVDQGLDDGLIRSPRVYAKDDLLVRIMQAFPVPGEL